MSQGDFIFSETNSLDGNDSQANSDLINKIQPIIFNEFQPDITVYLTSLYTAGIKSMIASIKGASKKAGALFKIFDGLKDLAAEKVAQKLQNDLTMEYSINPASLYEGER
jgi:hypothetical protein